jgi:hypothetical protein
MHKLLWIQWLWLASVALGQAPASQPTPAVASAAWMLNFKFQDPQRLAVVEPGQRNPVVYWYMLYTVENSTKREVQFYPEFEIVTDTLQVVRSDRGASPAAYQAVVHRANDPALLPAERIAGRILVGKDRARHGVAIWKDFDPRSKAFTVFVGGLSGETARWKNPAFDGDKPEGPRNMKYFLLRKTLAIPYTLTSSESERSLIPPRRLAEKQAWVMR